MRIIYGQNRNGKRTFNIDHKFGRGTNIDIQTTMVMKAIIRKYPDAGQFILFKYLPENDPLARKENAHSAGHVCGGQFTETDIKQ